MALSTTNLAKGKHVGHYNGSAYMLSVDSDGHIQVDILSSINQAELIAIKGLINIGNQYTFASLGYMDGLEGLLGDLKVLIGEVSSTPTAYTLLARLKTLATQLDAQSVLIGQVQVSPTQYTLLERLKVVETHHDELQALIGEKQISPTQYTLLERLKNIESYSDGIEGYVDGIETLIQELKDLIGEVQSTPTTNTLLYRLKVLEIEFQKRVGGTIYDGENDVADTGTPEALAGSQALQIGVLITAKEGNTGWVKIGNASTQNKKLNPLDDLFLPINNLNLAYIDVEVNGEGVTYLGI